MMQKHFHIIFLIFFAVSAKGQTFVDSSLAGRRISAIDIVGNDKTKPLVFLREMKQQVGDTLDLEKTEEDRKRILNYNLFNRVMVIGQPDGQDVRLSLLVTEQWYLIPFPILQLVDRSWNKVSWGLGVRHYNFRGRAETLTGILKLGYNPNISMSYSNPWLTQSREWLARFEAGYSRIRSKYFETQEVDENHFRIRGTLGRRFGYHTFLSIQLGYRQVSFSPPVPGETLSRDGTDHMPELGIFYTWNHRDLNEYPGKGWLVRVSFEKKGFPGRVVDYAREAVDLRVYVPLPGQITLAGRGAITLSQGEIPVYDRMYLGYGERIRGHFYTTSVGENRLISSLAARMPILPVTYFDAASESEFSDLRFGISFGLFIDTGMTWLIDEVVSTQKLMSGYGGGLHFHLPYNAILRLETGWNEAGRQQWFVDMNVDI